MDSSYLLFTQTKLQKDSDCQFQETKREQSRHSPRLILLLHRGTVPSSSMLQKYYENGIIVFCVERSFRMCVTDFCLKKRQIPHEDKILNPQLAVAPSLRHHRWLSSCRRLSRGGPPRALHCAICQYSQRHSCIVHPRAQLFGAAISPMTGKALPSRDRPRARLPSDGGGRAIANIR